MRVSGALIRALTLLGAALAALVLGFAGFRAYAAHQPAGTFGRGWADILYADLQLFILSGPQGGGAGMPVALQIARFLAPASTVLAGAETLRLLLSEQLGYWTSAHARGHAVVAGDGPAAIGLARRLCREYRTVVLVAPSPATQAPPRPRGLLTVSGDPADPATLNATGLGRAEVVYACTDQSTTNAAIALRAREISRAHQRPLTAYAQVRDAEIATALRARHIGAAGDPRFRLDFFSFEEIAARVLLDRHRLGAEDGQAAEAVIVGLGQLGQAVLREIACRAQDGPRQRVMVVGGEAAGGRAGLAYRFPEVSRYCAVTGVAELPRSLGGSCPCLVFVCLPDNDEALRAGLAAAHALAGHRGRVVICMSQPSPFGAVLTGDSALLDNARGRLAVFDVLEEACVPELIRADLADQLARARHRAYVAACEARGESPDVNPSMRPWEELPEDLRHSNRAHIAHIGAKLDAIGCVIIPRSAQAPEFGFSGSEIEELAEMEHQRWVGERLARGYQHGDDRDGGQHPDLVDWDQLSDEARDKDRDTIRELPDILQRAGFRILRIGPQA